MVEKVTPFLMFQGKAEEAMAFYCETIPQSRVIDVTRHGGGEGEPGGARGQAKRRCEAFEAEARVSDEKETGGC